MLKMVAITYTGDVKKSEYDHVIDVDRMEFTDKANKTDCYIEIPRLEGKILIQDNKTLSVLVTDDDKEAKKIKDPVLVFNSTLYMVRKTSDDKPKDVVQFSAGGTVLRLLSDKQTTFKLRGNRNFKIVVK